MLQLPNELVTLIIKQCSPSWSVNLKPCFRNDRRSSIFDHWDLEGFPDVGNIKLVNKHFYREINQAIQASFTGKVSALNDDLDITLEYFNQLPQWLWNYTTVLVLPYACNIKHWKECLAHIKMPRLQRVRFSWHWMPIIEYKDMPAVFTGRFSDDVIHRLSEDPYRGPKAWGFWLGKLKEGRGVDLVDVEVEWRIDWEQYDEIEVVHSYSGTSPMRTVDEVKTLVRRLKRQQWHKAVAD